MRKLLFVAIALVLPFLAAGQEKRVNFRVDGKGDFVRTDSDKNYYVFEYDPGLSAEDMKEMFHKKWEELSDRSSYFECYHNNSSFDSRSGTIEGHIRDVYVEGYSERLRFDYAYSLQFRDGRVRIDPPTVTPWIHGEKTYPDVWMKKRGMLENKEKAANENAQVLQRIGNGVINELLAFIDGPEEDWSNPQAVTDLDRKYFHLGDQFGFVYYPYSKDYAVFSLNGLSKNNIMELYKTAARSFKTRDKSFYDNLSFYSNGEGLTLEGGQSIYISDNLTGLSDNKCVFYYKAFIDIKDNIVKVYVPKVESVEVYRYDRKGAISDISAYDNFAKYLYYYSLCKSDGTHKDNLRAAKGIEKIEETFNLMLLAPLYFIQRELDKRNQPEEEW